MLRKYNRNLVSRGLIEPAKVENGETVLDETDPDSLYIIHKFTNSDNVEVSKTGKVQYLLVAGGGGAGASGAGAGGLLQGSTTLTSGSHQIIIGAGGVGSSGDGSDSEFDGLVAIGGAGAPPARTSSGRYNGRNGGSGSGPTGTRSTDGGEIGLGVVGQGHNSGQRIGGSGQSYTNSCQGAGGGAGSPGSNNNPGSGIEWPPTSGNFYAVGGAAAGAGVRANPTIPPGGAELGSPGLDGTGSGASQGGTYGGSGILILRYPVEIQPITTTPIPDQTVDQELIINLDNYFSNDLPIEYQATSSDNSIAKTSVAGSTLTITGLVTGSVTISTTGNIGTYESAQQTFTASVVSNFEYDDILTSFETDGNIDRYVNLGTDALYLPNNHPFTAEAWVKFNSFDIRDIIITRDLGNPYAWILGFHDNTNISAFDGGGWRSVPFQRELGTWYHVSYIFDGTTMKFVVNNDLIGEVSFSFSDDPNYITSIGGYDGNGTHDFDGEKTDVRFWNFARTQTEIQNDRTRRLIGSETGLIGYWKFDEITNNNTTIPDSSPSGFDGTLASNTHTLNIFTPVSSSQQLPLSIDVDNSGSLDLSTYYTGSSVQYSVSSSDETTIITSVQNNVVEFTAISSGSAQLNITAQNSFIINDYVINDTVDLNVLNFTEISYNITGGEVYDIGQYRYHKFNSSGDLSVETSGTNFVECEVLIVGGGGGSSVAAGGGGAGGVITETMELTSGSYTSIIGSGGTGPNSNGGNSEFNEFIALGGGGGGGYDANGSAGGSGGGAGRLSTTYGEGLQPTSTSGGFGNRGGSNPGSDFGTNGGGGGASQVGGDSSGNGNKCGDGGDGLQWLDGNYYAGGGGGSHRYSGTPGDGGIGGGGDGAQFTGTISGTNGEPNTGGGAGGLGTGGSGVIIVRYLIALEPITTSPIPDQTVDDATTLELNNFFTHTNSLNYSVSIQNENIVSYSLSGSQLNLFGSELGNTAVTVTATTGTETEQQTFNVEVTSVLNLPYATGGDSVYEIDGYRYHEFTTTGTGSLNVERHGDVDVLIVGAGGSGGGGISSVAWGTGGGGGEVLNTTSSVTPQSYNITVGDSYSLTINDTGVPGIDGDPSSAFGITARGGKGGTGNGGDGQGGNSGNELLGGSRNGLASGGGAGAGQVGGNAPSTTVGGQGGDGVDCSQKWGLFVGDDGWFGGGGAGFYGSGTNSEIVAGGKGGGASMQMNSRGTLSPGMPNSGGGGSERSTESKGGTGTVIVRYPLPPSNTVEIKPNISSMNFGTVTQANYIELNDPIYNLSSGFTISLLMKTTTTHYWNNLIAKGYDDGSYTIRFYNQTGRILLEAGGSSVASINALNDGHWHLLTMTWDGTTLRGYVDSELQGTSPLSSISTNINALRIGSGYTPYAGQNHYSGLLDEVQLWNKPLSRSEIVDFNNQILNGDEQGLVGYWNFEDRNPTQVTDLTPNLNHGTLVGNPTYEYDGFDFNYAMEFDGVDDYVDLGLIDVLPTTLSSPFSIEVMANPVNITSTNPEDFIRRLSSNTEGIVFTGDSQGNLLINIGSGLFNRWIFTTPAQTTWNNEWALYSVTYDGSGTTSGVKMYRNGVQLSLSQYTAGGTIDPPLEQLNNGSVTTYIGGYPGSSRYYTGLLDNIRIWNTARTQQEIRNNINEELNGDETGLVGYWKFDDLTDLSVAVDSSPNGNNGTING